MSRNFPLETSELSARIKCRDCEIFIGPGHFDAVPVPTLERDGYLCGACHQADERRRRGGWRAVVWND